MSELFGYTKIEEDILKILDANKLHHALIFCGIEGIGKSSFVKLLAQKITKSKFDTTNNPDIILIQRELNPKKELAKNITVDTVRKINDFINLTPSTSKYRIIIINSIDCLNKNSANALLKNLEEPPRNTFFFLINHNQSTMPDTIKSRCNLIKIGSPSYLDFSYVVRNNSLNIGEKELLLLFEISSGSIGLALKFYQNGAFENYQNIIKIITKSETELNLMKFIEELLKNDGDLIVVKSLLGLICSRILKMAVNNMGNEFFENEGMLFSKYLQNNSVDDVFRKYYEVSNLLSKIIDLNLDKKQSLINIFNIL